VPFFAPVSRGKALPESGGKRKPRPFSAEKNGSVTQFLPGNLRSLKCAPIAEIAILDGSED
jgi:hypothetical protein